jgi:hypothetical protein
LFHQLINKEQIMNVLKNMEAIFVVAVALSLSAAAFAKAPAASATKPVIAANTKMIKVVITGKRLSAAEKAQLAAL